MKVTTDGCLFGAIAAGEISNYGAAECLDIGTGTGLLTLMVAQQNADALIDAVEIDEAAANQAKENVIASPWAKRINILNGDILQHVPVTQYDVIISNPPFYERQLASPDASRRQAHHSSDITLRQLIQQAVKLLTSAGNFFVMMPYYRTAEAIAIAQECGLTTEKHWLIQQTPKHSFFRSIFCFSLQSKAVFQSVKICIKNERNIYSTTFTELLKAYYLKF